MDKLIVHNQDIISIEEARLSPGQAGLLLGWGVFTTLRLYDGAPFEFSSHWRRMARDADRLSVSMGITEEALRQQVIDLARRNGREEGMVRLSFVRNSGGSWGEPGNRPPVDLLIFTRPLPEWPDSYRLQMRPGAVFSGGAFAGAKMLSWGPNSRFMEEARAAGYDDALLLNEFGQIAECTSANIFIARGGRAITPPLSSGCLPGVTREILLKIGSKSGVTVEEAEITMADLDRADEVFITSTTRDVGSVREVAGRHEYPVDGSVTRTLRDAFQKYVESARRSG